MRTPGILNPASFSSKQKLQEALKKQGESRGWTLMPDTDNSDIDSSKSDLDESDE